MLNVFFNTAKMNIQFMQRGEESAHCRALRHLGKGVDIFGETLAAVAELTIRSGNICVSVVDIARKQNARMHLRPIAAHFLNTMGSELIDTVVIDTVTPWWTAHMAKESLSRYALAPWGMQPNTSPWRMSATTCAVSVPWLISK